MPVSAQMRELLARGTTRVIYLIAVESLAGEIIRVCRFSRNFVFENQTYFAMPFEASEIQLLAGVTADNAQVDTVLNSTLTRLNLVGGKWQGAKVELIIADWSAPEAGAARRHRGRIGEVQTGGVTVKLEFRSLIQLLSQEIGDKTSRKCRYKLGDQFCTVNLATYTFAGTVTAKTNNQKITVSVVKPDGYFDFGEIHFTTGANAGLGVEISKNAGQVLTLFLPMPADIAVGDGVAVIAGDDKLLRTCWEKFNNAVNHGGEEPLPLRETVYKLPE